MSTAVLGETQRLRAVVRGAEKRADAAEQAAQRAEAEAAEAAAAIIRATEAARQAAWLELETAQAALDAHAKQQRMEGQHMEEPSAIKQPDWRSRPYAAYDTVDKWVKREGELWNRRRVELSADTPSQPAEKLKPRGPTGNDGPLNHSIWPNFFVSTGYAMME